MDNDALMTTQEVAELFRVPVSTVYRWRYIGDAPAAFRVGRHLRFRKSAINDWLATREERENRPAGEHH